MIYTDGKPTICSKGTEIKNNPCKSKKDYRFQNILKKLLHILEEEFPTSGHTEQEVKKVRDKIYELFDMNFTLY